MMPRVSVQFAVTVMTFDPIVGELSVPTVTRIGYYLYHDVAKLRRGRDGTGFGGCPIGL